METVTILLAEDQGLLLTEFEDALSEAGFNVISETNGKEAIDRLRSGDPSIDGLITDILFPDSPDGWEVARIAREINTEIPVVYITGSSSADWASKGVPKSIRLEKPFAVAQLISAISQLLNDRSPGTAA
ncbi:response regulator [Sinorhizobium meliloti]|uniref:response regulator n=1 Tax=Rhizobium meliloti TaxID=382 RepID=UPI00028614F5|nr:response regulator [Sinorhizobium meliloti]MDX1247086.1 response regulator [Sinorhizobium medicae]ASP79055.1 response regulator [Sinorhizobium meliloti]MDE4601386.1 response regulator [Sinorhizobium meliloti]MQW18300.1 response regulator [Sinorhizobium meliloti]QND25677.1 response regulator [Sinorhizobium meliloti]